MFKAPYTATIMIVLHNLLLSTCAIYQTCCPNITTQENFDQNKYQGLWHDEEHSNNVEYVCATHNYTVASEGLLHLNSFLQNENGSIVEEEGSFLIQETDYPQGVRLVTASQWLDLAAFYVLHTDYETYSVEYACICSEDAVKIETVYVLWRSVHPNELHREFIQELLTKNGVDAELTRNHHQCTLNS